ncbi:MAG: zinc ribbon domain-containing protein [bacterium]
MKEHFSNLRALQEIDIELKNLNERLTELPRRVQELNRIIESARVALETRKQALPEHKKQYKLTEVDLRSTEEKIATYSVQLYSAKTNEQYKAFIREIETQKKLKIEIEDKMIALMEEIDRLEKEIKEQEKAFVETESEIKKRLMVLEKERQEMVNAIDEREKRRAEIAMLLPPELLRRYDRIRVSKGGLAVTSTEHERCNGCLSPIPPQRLLEIARQDKLYLCEACGRILVPAPEPNYHHENRTRNDITQNSDK